jgi:hypothetical protein
MMRGSQHARVSAAFTRSTVISSHRVCTSERQGTPQSARIPFTKRVYSRVGDKRVLRNNEAA